MYVLRKYDIRDTMDHIINDVKAALVICASTLGAGLGLILEWIPDDIGKLAVLFSMVLTVIVARNHLRKGRMDHLQRRKLELEVKALETET